MPDFRVRIVVTAELVGVVAAATATDAASQFCNAYRDGELGHPQPQITDIHATQIGGPTDPTAALP